MKVQRCENCGHIQSIRFDHGEMAGQIVKLCECKKETTR